MATALPIAPTPNTAETNSQEFDLVAMLLEQQQTLTAVERFSALHDQGHLPESQPAQARYYQSLLPATPPGPQQQYAFHVDLDACSGCKACVVACHTLNGLDEDESWRRVGTMTLGGAQPRIQHVTTACHHCEDPGCLNGCPVVAYEKDPETGIVRHLDDQCIGCKYCTMMCPYEVPQYSKRLGIVRKCDMCHQRLQVGEAPACVQSCPNEAISIRLVDITEAADSRDTRPWSQQDRLTPGAPLSSITHPTTTFHSGQTDLANHVDASSVGSDQVSENHWPLAIMLVATQISVGMLIAERLVAALLWADQTSLSEAATRWSTTVAVLIGGLG
ncbi:MAG: 4Fe-4S dicluster domain-containing protein, partial [Pirellulales bacterium]|nr:4Fe-4S dicluster domain-containing protein [Pirellulales bacterium]